ncbi:MAG: hypothetical protein N2Z61_00370, partial [Tepidimonas fonticaldi]|nr:hypothetical protein [Tepidimonas fonticaldi]
MAQQYVIDPRHPKRREREEEQAGNAATSVNWDEFTPVSQPISRNVNWDAFTPVDGASPARAERRDSEGGSQIEAFLAGRSPAKAGTIDDFLRGAPRKRSWGEVAQDTAVQLAEGVNTIIGAVPNLVAPESRAAGFFRDNAEFWRERQSDPLKARIARADQAIDAAGEDGVIAQITEAAGQYFSDPALAARFVVTNLPSMIPGIGVAKLSQAAALARGASAAKAASVATTAAGATNAVLNAGGARGEAFEDIKRTLKAQGYSPEQAERLALEDSRVVAAVGGLAGFASGKTGLEGSIVGKVGAGGAVKAGARAAAAELAGEQVEEVAPKIATNVQAGQYDGRAVTQDVGRTIVETAIGSGPGAIVAGGATAMEARRSTGEAPPSIAHPTMPGSPEDSIRIEPARDPQPAPTTTGRQMRPEARLAELEMIQLSRPLNEVEIAEAQSLLNEIQAGQSEDLFAQDIAPPELTQEAAPQELTAAPPAVEPAPRSAPIEAQPAPVTQTIAAEDVPDVGAAPAAQPVTQPSVQTQAEPAPTNFWSFAKTKGYKPGQIKIGTPEHTALKAEYDALRQGQTAEHPPVEPLNNLPDPALQNRDRSRAASVVQMSEIARNPDYMRLGPSRTPDSGAPMVFAVGDQLDAIAPENFGRQDVA